MIKKNLIFIAATLVAALTLNAQEAPKVGIVDLDLVLQQYDKFTESKSELEEQQQRADAELRPMVDSINALRQELEAINGRINNPATSEESQMEARNEGRQLQAQLERQAVEFQRLRQEAQRTIAQREQNMLAMILDDVRGATAVVAENEGIDLVFSNQNQIVLFFSSSLELSDKVLEQLEKGEESE